MAVAIRTTTRSARMRKGGRYLVLIQSRLIGPRARRASTSTGNGSRPSTDRRRASSIATSAP